MTLWSKLVAVTAEERRPFFLLLGYSFLTGATIVFTYTAALALFLADFGATNLPFAYIAASVVMVVIGALYARLEARLPAAAFFNLALLFLLVTGAGLWLAYRLQAAGWVVVALIIWFRLVYVLVRLTFWGVAGQIFSLQQGKRLFGLIGLGETMALTIGYASVPWFVGWLGTVNLLLIAVFAFVLTLLLLTRLRRYLPASRPAPASRLAPSAVETPAVSANKALYSDRYIRLIFGGAFIAIVVYFLVDFAFFNQVRSQFTTADEVAAFLGRFWTTVYVVGLLLRLFVSGPFLQRWGVGVGLMLLPLSLTAALALLLVANLLPPLAVWVFFLAGLVKLVDDAFGATIHHAASLLLYQPLAQEKRLVTQVVAEGVVVPVGIGTAGILLLLLQLWPQFNLSALVGVLLVISGLWVALNRRAFTTYRQALREALSQRRLQGQTQFLDDADSVAVIQTKLDSDHPGEVLYALNLLATAAPAALPDAVQRALHHQEHLVQAEALHLYMRQADPSMQPMLRRLLAQSPDAELRPLLVQALYAVAADEMLGDHDYLDDPDEAVATAALIGALKYRPSLAESVRARLQHLVRAANPEQRHRAAFIIGEVAGDAFQAELLQLLADADLGVRRAALAALEKVPLSPIFIPQIVAALPVGILRRRALSALVCQGDAGWQYLEHALNEYVDNPQLLAALLPACGRMGGEQAVAALKHFAAHDQEMVRLSALRTLHYSHYVADTEPAKSWVETRLVAEMAFVAWLARLYVDLAPVVVTPLLPDALTQAWQAAQTRLFYLLAFVYERRVLIRAQIDLAAPVNGPAAGKLAQRRGLAEEVLTTLLSSPHQRLVLPALTANGLGSLWQQLERRYDLATVPVEARLRELVTAPAGTIEPWLRATAVYEVGCRQLLALAPQLAPLALSENKLLAETAAWAQARLSVGQT